MLHRIDGWVVVANESLEETVNSLKHLGVDAMPSSDENQIGFSFFVREYADYAVLADGISAVPGIRAVQYTSSAVLAAEHLRLEALRTLQRQPVSEPYED